MKPLRISKEHLSQIYKLQSVHEHQAARPDPQPAWRRQEPKTGCWGKLRNCEAQKRRLEETVNLWDHFGYHIQSRYEALAVRA